MNTTLNASKAILVTGASTGIGQACAIQLAERGFLVFAGVRRHEDAEVLLKLSTQRLVPLLLDVTDNSSIIAAVSYIQSSYPNVLLVGLVNNAGIAVASPLEFVPMEGLHKQFDVNVFGQIRVIQAFLPMLRRAKGRIINMSSIAGRLTSPFVGPYSASKFALEALSDALRVELQPWGIDVIVVEPGVIQTPIWSKSLNTNSVMLKDCSSDAEQLYGWALKAMQNYATTVKGIPASKVADIVSKALTVHRPKTRYAVGTDAKVGIWLTYLPDRLRDWLFNKRLRSMESKANTTG